MAQQQVPEGKFYSRLYVEPGAPQDDSERFRNRLAAYFCHNFRSGQSNRYGIEQAVGSAIEVETGYQGFDAWFTSAQFDKFFQRAPLVDVFTAITIVWQKIIERRAGAVTAEAKGWQAFVERVIREENLSYRVDSKCGIHPLVDQEFDRNRVSVLACLTDARYAAGQHAVEAAFDQLNTVPMDGKGAARNIFEAAESLTKTITSSGSALTEAFVNRELRALCDRVFNGDDQLRATAARLLSSFGKWVDAIHPYRHGHERDQPLVLPDDLAILAVSQGAGFIRWLVDLDRRTTRA